MNTQYDTLRSVVDLRDIENGDYINANELLENASEDQNAQIRAGLHLAQKSGMFKYVCAICGQPLRLCRRLFERKESWFFAHFPNSEDCPIKTESGYTPYRWAELWAKLFKESKLHAGIVDAMYHTLSNSYEFSDVAKKKRISFPEITEEWRIPDVTAQFKNKKMVFEFQLYTTFLSTIIDRNSFYRLVGIDILWVFPYFTKSNQKLCEKDTYYSHKRNVFVFDTESYYGIGDDDKPVLPFDKINYKFAQEESLRRGTLMLNCYWQEPYVLDNKLLFNWHHKLISVNDLKFDDKTHDVYYIDSDQLFYEKADNETKKIFDEWKEVKEKRWDKIFRDIKERENLSYMSQEESEKRNYQREANLRKSEIVEQARKGEIELQLFSNKRSEEEFDDDGNPLPDLWGYKYNDIVVIEPKYEEAKPFSGGIAAVKTKKKGRWGAIDMEGKKVIPFQYDSFVPVTENCFAVSKDHKYGCLNQKGSEIVPFIYGKMTPVGNLCLLVNTGWWSYEKFWNGTWYDGYWSFKEGKSLAIDLEGKELFNVPGTEIKKLNDYLICGGSYSCCVLFDTRGKRIHDCIFESCEIINDNVIVSRFIEGKRKYGILSKDGKEYLLSEEYDSIDPINSSLLCIKKDDKCAFAFSEIIRELSDFMYDSIEAFSDAFIKVKENGRYGLCDLKMNKCLDSKYDDIVCISDDYSKVEKDGRWALFNNRTQMLSENYYYDIAYDESHKRLNAYQDYGHSGELSSNGFPITTKVCELIPGYDKFKRLGYYGIMGIDGSEPFPNEYDEIEYVEEVKGLKVSIGGRYGLLDFTGKRICDLKYDYIGNFEDGLAEVKAKDSGSFESLTGHINTKGEVVVEYLCEIVPDVFVGRKMGKLALLNKNKNNITDYIYKSIELLGGKYYIVKEFYPCRLGVLDLEAKPVLMTEFLQINFENDLFIVKDFQGKFGCYNSRGKPIIEHQYNKIEIWENDYLMASKCERIAYESRYRTLYTLFNKIGKQISDTDCNSIVKIEGNKFLYGKGWGVFGVFDYEGKSIVPCIYNHIEYRDGLFYVTKNGHSGELNLDGTVRSGQTLPISDSIVARETFGIWKVCDDNGQPLLNNNFVLVDKLKNQLFRVAVDKNRYGILNSQLDFVQPMEYDEIVIKDGSIMAHYDDKWYEIDDDGNIVPLIIQLANKKLLVSERDKSYLKDEHENIIKEFDFTCEGPFKYDVAIVKKTIPSSKSFEHKYGIIDNEGNEIIPVKYGFVKVVNKYYFLVGCGLTNHEGKYLIPPILPLNHIKKELTHTFVVHMTNYISRKYIKWDYYKKNGVPRYNSTCEIKFDFKNGLPDYLQERWKLLLDLENEKEKVFDGTIVKIKPYGIFIKIDKYDKGLIPDDIGFKHHIDKVCIGKKIRVTLLRIDWDKGYYYLKPSE